MKRPRPAVIVLALSGMTLIATPLAIAAAGPPAETVITLGDRHASAAVIATETAPSIATDPLSAIGGALAPGVSITQLDRAATVYAPVRVRIPAIDVDAPVVPVGLDAAGAVAIPEDIATVGWYLLGVAPGSAAGSAVLVGHRDGRVDGRGALYHLAQLVPDDRIRVIDAVGRSLLYAVVAREVVAKSVLPTDDLFAIDGPPRLTVITCGGAYERDAGGYQANVIITAVPIDAPTP